MEFVSLNGHRWYAIYTHVRFEKLVAAALQARLKWSKVRRPVLGSMR
jgi:hypothetical protein